MGTTEQNDIIARTPINHGTEGIIQQRVTSCIAHNCILALPG